MKTNVRRNRNCKNKSFKVKTKEEKSEPNIYF